MRLHDRLLTPAGARAVTSPGAIVAAGAGAAVGVLVGVATPVLAPLLGVAAYAAVVARQLPGRRHERIDPAALHDPWRHFVLEALDARGRFDTAVGRMAPGPLRDRLTEIRGRVDDGVEESWRIARHGDALEGALRGLDPTVEVEARLQRAEAEARDVPGDPGPADVAEALRAQLASTRRIVAVTREARDRLRVLDARLDEAVARAVELALTASNPREVGGLTGDVDAIVGDLEALRVALDETTMMTMRPGTG